MDIYIKIAHIISSYEQVNGIWEDDPCHTDIYAVLRQEKYKAFFDEQDKVTFEKLILELLSLPNSTAATKRLRQVIETNIHIYESRRSDFAGIDFLELHHIDEKQKFGNEEEKLRRDKVMIADYPYSSERERQMLLDENRSEMNKLQSDRSDYRRQRTWIITDFYTEIYNISKGYRNILDGYFPVEKETNTVLTEKADAEPEVSPKQTTTISPDTIFRSKKYDKFRELEEKLIKNGDLDTNLNWSAEHKNHTKDIKRLVTFMTALMDNGYFLPSRDSAIKAFFESRYRINIGQNFERKRREPLLTEYKAVFYDYPF